MPEDTGSPAKNYQIVFELNPHPILLVDQSTGLIVDVNSAAMELYAYTREQFLGLHVSALDTEDLQRKLESGLRVHLRSDASKLQVEVTVLGFEGENAKEAFFIVQDVSGRQQKEMELKERLRFERLVAEISSRFANRDNFDSTVNATLGELGHFCGADRSYVFLVDKSGLAVDNSHEWCASGVFPLIDSLQGLAIASYPWFFGQLKDGQLLHFSDVSKLPPLAEAEKKVIEAGGVRSMICMPMRRNEQLIGFVGIDNVTSTSRWTRIEIECLQVFSDLILSALAQEDMSQQLRLNSSALNAAANSIMITDLQGRIEWVNDAFVNCTGFSRAEAVGSSPGKLLKSGVHDPSFYKSMWDTILAGKVWRGEICNRRRDGSLYPEQQTITPVPNSAGAITHFVAIKEDATEKKQTEAKLLQAQKMDALGRLAGGVAHDFNNMLSIIIGHGEMLRDRNDLEESIRTDLDEIVRAGKYSANLTKQLLAFASMQPISPKLVNLNDIVSPLISTFETLLGNDIDLTWSPSQEPLPVEIDPNQIYQVLVNLLLNARDAIRGKGQVSIETSLVHTRPNSLKERELVSLKVADNGKGMDAETEARAFEPFFTTKAVGQGSGLGLPTVFGIARQNNGFVELCTSEGKGTSVSLCLPPQDERAVQIASKEVSPTEKTTTDTLLLVEDEPALLRLSRRLLEKMGYRVLAAETPEMALELSKKHSQEIDLLVTDVMMPGMSGNEVYRHLLELRPDLPCLYVSGYPADVISRKGVLDEGVHFLQKPFTFDELARSVRAALAK